MVYTCYEMIRDCRQDRPEGWSYFVQQYVPVVRALLAHYFPDHDAEARLERVLLKLRDPQSSVFQSLEPAPERAFVAGLRQHTLAAAEGDRAGGAPPGIEIETLSAALEPLSLTEKLAVWFETMLYDDRATGRMQRMSPETAGKIRARAADLIRGSLDNWSRTLLADNGAQLGAAAVAQSTQDCLPAKAFFDVIDGRATWRGREEMERHVKSCWHCVDHYCRLLEVVDLLRAAKPLAEPESARYRQLLGIETAKRSFWKR